MRDEVPPGRHMAKVIDYGLTETKSGDPQVRVKFKLDGDGAEITWFGSLKAGRAQEITIDALLAMGFMGSDLTTLEGGASSGALNEKKSVSITVDQEEFNGKMTTKVKWVNPLDGGAKKMDPSKKTALKALSGLVMARRKETGITSPAQQDDELPF